MLFKHSEHLSFKIVYGNLLCETDKTIGAMMEAAEVKVQRLRMSSHPTSPIFGTRGGLWAMSRA